MPKFSLNICLLRQLADWHCKFPARSGEAGTWLKIKIINFR